MDTPVKCSKTPVLTRKDLRKYSSGIAGVYLPKELEDYLLDEYNGDDAWVDEEGHDRRYSLTDEDIWYNIRNPILEYARIKDAMDELLSSTEYLGDRSLTIRVTNKKTDFLRQLSVNYSNLQKQKITQEGSDDIPF